MKSTYITGLRTDMEIQDFFMVKMIAVRIGANKKQYLDLALADKSGDISAKKWDVMDEELPALNLIQEGDIVKIKGTVTEWNVLKQIRVGRVRKSAKEDGLELSDYIRSAPEKGEDMFAFILEKARAMEDSDLCAMCGRLLAENREKLLYYPAAHKNHHAELGGLLHHMKRMLQLGEKICEIYTELNGDLVTAGIIVHDIEKLNEIEANELGIASGYSFEGQMLGHIVQGIITVDRIAAELNFPREKAVMLEHMVLSHHYEPEFGSPKRPLFPEAEVLHYLDILDARLYDMWEAIEGTEPGDFSDRVWTLENRKIYRVK